MEWMERINSRSKWGNLKFGTVNLVLLLISLIVLLLRHINMGLRRIVGKQPLSQPPNRIQTGRLGLAKFG